ncbi:MAG: DNA replication and repair protein RecF [bacterium]|nr:DNA replication and repair protein RecF [bacterium]
MVNNRKVLITRVAARDFRNYQQVEALLSPKWTVLYGKNGAGKTNFLELLVLSLQGVSFRGKLRNLLRWETAETKIVTEIEGDLKISTRVFFDAGKIKQERLLDNHSVESFEEIVPPIVLFLPQEEYLLDSPAGRRKILSRGLILQSQTYRQHFGQYVRILKQRNSLLRFNRGIGASDELSAWTEAIVEPMLHIWKMRKKFLDVLNKNLPETIKSLGGISLALHAELSFGGLTQEDLEPSAERIFARFNELAIRESEMGSTLIGPHRDLFRFVHEGHDALPLLSRGQRRLLLLALHIIEGEYAGESLGVEPIFILDDIFSELDSSHREAIGSALKDCQVVATTADRKILPKLAGSTVYYEVEKGTIQN